MKKLCLLIGMVALLATACEKEDVVAPIEPQEDALADVIRIAQEGATMLDDAETRSAVGRRIDHSRISCKINPATRAGESDDTLYYVVNYADNAGFAIVSANEEAPDGARLIAVTESGSYTAGEKTDNEGFNMYMGMVERSIIDLEPIKRDSLAINDEVVEDYYSDWTTVGPYIQVKWGQGRYQFGYNPNYPYNKYFYDNQNNLCPAGCTTVAIAQIMSYYRKPEHYTVTYDGSNVRKAFDWDVINACVGGVGYVWSTDTADMIAVWFREIAKRASSTLSSDEGTSATILGAREAFARFGYDQDPQRAYNWADITTELNAGRLVWMRGTTDYLDSKAGHAWAIDGYKTRTHYYRVYTENLLGERVYQTNITTVYNYNHINWGYDGKNNGYYASGVFDMLGEYEFDDSSLSNTVSYDFYEDLLIVTKICHNGNDVY